MRQIVRAALPLGRGLVLDPFMGAGSTIAAASAVGYQSVGIEIDPIYFGIAGRAIPTLARFGCECASSGLNSGEKNIAAAGGPGNLAYPKRRFVR